MSPALECVTLLKAAEQRSERSAHERTTTISIIPTKQMKPPSFASPQLVAKEQSLHAKAMLTLETAEACKIRQYGKGMTLRERQERASGRTDKAIDLMLSGANPKQAMRRIRTEEGVALRTARRAVTRACDLIRVKTGQDRESSIGESLQFYLRISMNSDVPFRDRIRARERADQLRGLDAPRQIHARVDTTMLSHDGLMAIVRAHFPAIAAEQEAIEAQRALQLTNDDDEYDGDNGSGEDDDYDDADDG